VETCFTACLLCDIPIFRQNGQHGHVEFQMSITLLCCVQGC